MKVKLYILTVLLFLAASTGFSGEQQSVVAPGAQVKKLAGGFSFTEGPASDAAGNIFFTDIPNNRIHKWSLDGKLTIFRKNSGGANGLFFDKIGNMLVCEGGGRRLVSINPQGEVEVLAEKYQGKRFNSLNDLWIDPKGGIYFTDPRYGSRDDMQQGGEHVYYLAPGRKQITRVIDDMVRPNGVIGTPDGKILYVTDHGGGKTFRYTINKDGTLSNKKLFAPEGSDGMTIDNQGNVYLTRGGVTVYNKNGEKVEVIKVPEGPANVCFGGKDKKTLFITARTSLYSVRMRVSGVERSEDIRELKLRDWEPRSMLKTKESVVNKPAYPLIDVHNHLGGGRDRLTPGRVKGYLAEMDAAGVRTVVNLDGGWGEGLKETLSALDETYPERFLTFALLNFDGIDDKNWGRREARRLEESFKAGAKGLKFHKSLGLSFRYKNGKLMPVDDPKLDPVWRMCARYNRPVVIHVADPAAFFTPLDSFNERWHELNEHPNWLFHGERFPARNEILKQRNRAIARHPKTTFICAHFGNNPEDLETVGKWLVAGKVSQYVYRHRCEDFRIGQAALYGTEVFPEVSGPYYVRDRYDAPPRRISDILPLSGNRR